MKFIVHVPSYHSVCNDGHLEVEAESREKALEKVFLTLPAGRGLRIDGVRFEDRAASEMEKFLGFVTELRDKNSSCD